jgi:Amidase
VVYFLTRVEALDKPINSVVTIDAERARAEGDAADAALARGEVRGPLHGVPINPFLGRVAYLFPQGGGRVRAYLMYEADLPRLQSDHDTARFVAECVKTGLPPETYAGARPVGPLASFDMTESCVDHPYHDGVVLLGDAAGSSDPTCRPASTTQTYQTYPAGMSFVRKHMCSV